MIKIRNNNLIQNSKSAILVIIEFDDQSVDLNEILSTDKSFEEIAGITNTQLESKNKIKESLIRIFIGI